MKTDIFDSINQKLTPDQSLITELLEKAGRKEFPEEPVIDIEQAPAELFTETERDEPVEEKEQPKIKVRSKLLPFAAAAAALVIVCTGGFFLLRGTGILTYPGAGNSENAATEEDLKTANGNAKLLFCEVNNCVADLIADGRENEIDEYRKSDNYGKPVRLSDLKKADSGNCIDYSIYRTFVDNEIEDGYIYFEIDAQYNVIAAQWAKSKDTTAVGQYPDPEFDPTVKHKIGEIYHSEGYDDYRGYDEIWDGLSVEIEPDSVTPTGLTVNFTRSCDLLDNQYQMVKSDYELFAYNDGSLDELDFISDARGYEYRDGVLRKENDALTYKYDWSNLYGALEPGDYSMGIHVITNGEDIRETQNYELQFTIPAEPVEVPDVVGMTSEQAQTALTQAGFKCFIRERYDDNAEKGIVVKQDKEAGTKYETGGQVVIFVSVGPVENVCKVPDVRDLTEEEAVAFIKENKLTPKVEYIQHDDSTKGRVVQQSISAGEYVDPNTEVILSVSAGIPELPEDWGITMRADSVTPNNMSLYFTSDGSAESCEVTTDTVYTLYKLVDGKAERLEPISGAFWREIALEINTEKNAETKTGIDFSEGGYGELEKGTYRIEKTLGLTSGLDGETGGRTRTFTCDFTVE